MAYYVCDTTMTVWDSESGDVFDVDSEQYVQFLKAGGQPVYESRRSLPGLEEVRAAAVAAVDAETSAAIIAGFEYDINGETLHFSYDTNDQQNFSDTGNAATLATMGVPGVPRSVVWNGWKVEKDGDGAVLSRSLVRLTLSVNDFLALYMSGALAHKAACMERGGQKKAAVEAAQTLEEIQAVAW